MKIRFTPRAIADVEAIHAYLVNKNPIVAIRVRAEIERAIARLGDFPLSGPPTDEDRLRLVQIQRYPCRVFYRVDIAELVILHIRHTSRRPADRDGL